MTLSRYLILLMFPVLASCDEYQPPDPGLLKGPYFSEQPHGENFSSAWAAIQHGGDDSYHMTTSDGVLRIERIGEEPWGQLVQRLSAEDLRGKTLEFSAELSGDLKKIKNPKERLANKTGLGVIVKGFPGSHRLRTLGKSILLTLTSESDLSAGEHDWKRHSIVFTVPEGATDIQVAIRMTNGGVLKARGPRLLVVEDG